MAVKNDRNFDDLTERFARNVYGSAKGEIRLAIVWQHLLQTLPFLEQQRPLRILDAGCGFGQMATRLLALGHEVTLADVSGKMLTEAEQVIATKHPDAKVEFIHAPTQSLDVDTLGQFDLILSHAVLEWLAKPKETLHHLLSLIKPKGHLSLMFYNKDALIFRNLIRGNWRKVESGVLQGDEGGLTPYHPLSLQEVESWLHSWQMEILSHAGVRVIYDYMEKRIRDTRPVDEIVRIELKYAQQEPYLHMGRYLHIVSKKVT